MFWMVRFMLLFLRYFCPNFILDSMTTRKAPKPFIAASVTPAPVLPPPLVLPSDTRRSSIINKPRSTSSSPAPQSGKPYTQLKAPTPVFHTPSPSSSNGSLAYKKSPSPQPAAQSVQSIPRSQPRKQPNVSASVPVPVPAPAPTPVLVSKPSFGQKLRKAFSFGSRKASADRASTMSTSTPPPPVMRKSQSTRAMTLSGDFSNFSGNNGNEFASFSSVTMDGPKKRRSSRFSMVDSDAVSVRSNTSSSSFSTLRKFGSSLNKAKNRLSSKPPPMPPIEFVNSAMTAAEAPAPHAATPAPPSVSHAVAEAERPEPIAVFVAETLASNDVSNDQVPVAEAEPTIKVNGSTEDLTPRTPSEDESGEDLNVADTVFPKSLDSLTVETIRSSLERTKSLERRRSRRSTKSSDSEKRKSSTLVNALEVHISQGDAALSVPGSPSASPLGILKTIDVAPESEAVQSPANTENDAFEFTSEPETISVRPNRASYIKARDNAIAKTNKAALTYHHPVYNPNRASNSRNSLYKAQGTIEPAAIKPLNKATSAVSFSSRILIYDTYDSVNYDRRAEISTCNRLNPILAQQIKEEINNFKMEMQVHAESRIYTHFF